MRRAFQGQKRRQLYDHAAIVEMAKTMTRREIVQKTGISANYLDQLLLAKGGGAKGKQPRTKISS